MFIIQQGLPFLRVFRQITAHLAQTPHILLIRLFFGGIIDEGRRVIQRIHPHIMSAPIKHLPVITADGGGASHNIAKRHTAQRYQQLGGQQAQFQFQPRGAGFDFLGGGLAIGIITVNTPIGRACGAAFYHIADVNFLSL